MTAVPHFSLILSLPGQARSRDYWQGVRYSHHHWYVFARICLLLLHVSLCFASGFDQNPKL